MKRYDVKVAGASIAGHTDFERLRDARQLAEAMVKAYPGKSVEVHTVVNGVTTYRRNVSGLENQGGLLGVP